MPSRLIPRRATFGHLVVSFLLVAAVLTGSAQTEDHSNQPKLPPTLAKHTLRDTGERQKLVLIASDGRQIVVEIPIVAYVPDYDGVDFLQAVKESKAANAANADNAQKGEAPSPPFAGEANKPAAKDPSSILQELREVMIALSKLERKSASPETAGELRALTFRIDAVVRELGNPR
jgi:hypothetical protein